MSSTLIGLILGFASVVGTIMIEGGNPLSYINPAASIIIVGGTMAAGIISFSLAEVFLIPKYILKAMFPPKNDFEGLIGILVTFSEKARREGILSLEEDVEEIEDELLRKGVELVVDGTDPEMMRQVLEDLSASIERHHGVGPEFFEILGGFSPTMGIIGTVMGLVHVLEGLGGAALNQLGEGIAVAFIATLYGIGFANLLWLPIANKMKEINKEAKIRNAIVISGVSAIQSGFNPALVKENLIACITDPELRHELRTKDTADEG